MKQHEHTHFIHLNTFINTSYISWFSKKASYAYFNHYDMLLTNKTIKRAESSKRQQIFLKKKSQYLRFWKKKFLIILHSLNKATYNTKVAASMLVIRSQLQLETHRKKMVQIIPEKRRYSFSAQQFRLHYLHYIRKMVFSRPRKIKRLKK